MIPVTKKDAMTEALQRVLDQVPEEDMNEGRLTVRLGQYVNGQEGPHIHATVTVTRTRRYGSSFRYDR